MYVTQAMCSKLHVQLLAYAQTHIHIYSSHEYGTFQGAILHNVMYCRHSVTTLIVVHTHVYTHTYACRHTYL